jgi:hypothetical protein
VFVRRTPAGAVERMSIAELTDDRNAELSVFDGAASEPGAPVDIDDVGAALEPGTIAAIVVYDNSGAVPRAVALHPDGASARVPVRVLLAALDNAM